MSGYGYYEEEGQGLETGGLMTGAGAKARFKYVYSREPVPGKFYVTKKGERKQRYYPKRGPMTIEYASKLVFNHNINSGNKWLNFANKDATLKQLRKEVAERMRELSEEYKKTVLTADERAKLESRKKPRTKKDRLAEAQARVAQFKAKYPTIESVMPELFKYVPDIRSGRIFLRALYGISKDQALAILPKRKHAKYVPQTFGEYSPGSQPPPQPSTLQQPKPKSKPPPPPEEETAEEEKAPPKTEKTKTKTKQ
jgi:hypothetical protein